MKYGNKMKTCSKCNTIKSLTEFYKDSSRSDKYSYSCKPCRKLISHSYYTGNKTKIRVTQNAYRDCNKDSVIKQQTIYRKKNLKNFAEKERVRYKTKPFYKTKKLIRNLIGSSFKTRGFSKNTKTAQILGCSFEEFERHLRLTFELNYGIPFNHIDVALLHVDHIIPLATAKTKGDIIKLNHYSNLQYLFAEDNLEKSDKLDWKAS